MPFTVDLPEDVEWQGRTFKAGKGVEVPEGLYYVYQPRQPQQDDESEAGKRRRTSTTKASDSTE